MTLQTDCLGNNPLSEMSVETVYRSVGDPHHPNVLKNWLKELCFSHERLRAELTGLEIVAKENEAIVERLDASMPYMAGGNILRMEATIEELKKVRG